MRKTRIVMAMFAALLLWVIPSQVKAAQNNVVVSADVTKDISTSRGFKISADVYSGEESLQQIKPSANIILLEVSASMMSLSGSPENNTRYFAGLPYRSIDEKSELYTLQEGEYKPIAFSDGKYTIASFEKSNEKKPTETIIGEKNDDATVFTQTVYEKGECQTKLEKISEELNAFIDNLASLSPQTQISMIYYAEDANIGENVELNEEGLKKLKEEITNCIQYIGANANSTQAVKLSKERIKELKENFPENINVLHFSDSAFIDEKGKDGDLNIAVQAVKTLGARVYMIGWFNQNEENEKNFMEMLAMAPNESYIKFADEEKISLIFDSLSESITGEVPIEVKIKLNSSFRVNKDSKEELIKNGAVIEENEKEEQMIIWNVNMPKTKKKPWHTEIKVVADDSFIGGNDVAILNPESGIYWYGEKKNDIQISTVNVPVKKTGAVVEKEIFLGQTVPKEIDGVSPMQALAGSTLVSSSSENSGKLVHIWKTDSGKMIGILEQLCKIKPNTNTDFTLISTFTPNSSGENSVGAPCIQTSIKSIYKIKVISGEVSIKAKLTSSQAKYLENTTNLFKLENYDGSLVQYRTINVGRYMEDDEEQSNLLQADFKDLPFGVYTLKNITNGEDDEGSVIVVGFKENSDIVSTKDSSVAVFVTLEKRAENVTVSERKYRMKAEG